MRQRTDEQPRSSPFWASTLTALHGGERWQYAPFGQTWIGNAMIAAAKDTGATDEQVRKALEGAHVD